MNRNDFGALIKAYREQRGWTQAELAERWGYAREYVSQIERGTRKLDSTAQVVRLADILGIPEEKLESIGRGIPKRKIHPKHPSQADDVVLHMLLAPSREMVQMSYMLWVADQHPLIEENLRGLTSKLDAALMSYRGEFTRPAQQLLAYTHQMRGRIALDRLDFSAASGHFSEMVDLGQELNDADIITIGMAYRGNILRKRGRFETAVRCFEAAKPYASASSEATQGIYHINLSTLYSKAGREAPFLEEIDVALNIASSMKDSIAGLANDFSLDDVLWSKADGLSELWKPKEALDVYQETDKLRPFRPLRELGAYTIDKGDAYLRLGELDEGVRLTLRGLQMASEYQSKRHISWIDKTYTRLSVLPIGKDKRLNALRDALKQSHEDQTSW